MTEVPEFQMNAQALTVLLENGPGSLDVHAFIMQQPDRRPTIRACYEITDYDGEEVDAGIESPEDGHSMVPSAEEMLEGETSVTLAITFLKSNYASQASASFFHPGIWYEDSNEANYRTGQTERRSFHLKGFEPEEEKAVYAAIMQRR